MAVMRKITGAAGGALLAGALVWALWPKPQPVDMAPVTRGPLEVVLLAEGITRVRDPYTITAPIAGTTTRSPVQIGDQVQAGETVVAVIQPADPALMDARSRAQAEAAIVEAEAAVVLAQTNISRAESALAHARHQYERGQGLAQAGTIAQRMLEDLAQAVTAATQTVAVAQAEHDLARAALARAQAQLTGPAPQRLPTDPPGECCVQLLAPLTGTVLDVTDRNARQVAAGTPLLTLGNITDLEIETDLLSADALRVPPGARALVERWGGAGLLEAQVRRIEPAAFTRISALGIEEQRVRVALDLLSPPERRAGLGDQFRVHLRIVLWQTPDALQIPNGALFRHEGGWAVFRETGGRAEVVAVELGQQARDSSQVLAGLAEGDRVILYPAAGIAQGSAVAAR
jgi:HlyD family secretion protein